MARPSKKRECRPLAKGGMSGGPEAMTFHNGWTMFAAVAAAWGCALCLETIERKPPQIRRAVFIVMLVSSAYLLPCGIDLLVTWKNPFAGAGIGEIAKAIHNPKAWPIVGIISIWPYFLIVVSSLLLWVSVKGLRSLRPRKPAEPSPQRKPLQRPLRTP
jgi:hypothetical protein